MYSLCSDSSSMLFGLSYNTLAMALNSSQTYAGQITSTKAHDVRVQIPHIWLSSVENYLKSIFSSFCLAILSTSLISQNMPPCNVKGAIS